MKPVTIAVAAVLVVTVCTGPLAASPGSWDEFIRGGGGIVWDQQPLDTGGPGADTDFYTDSGLQFWQLNADDIILDETATIRRIVWWGFYGAHFSGSTLPPTGAETMRVRFYDARPGDGLPGDVLFEESLLNPSRTWTGGYVVAVRDHPEYIFQADLSTPFQLNAGVPYWLEIVQIGDVDSHYRWEYSPPAGTPYAYKNLWVPDWQRTTLGGDLAFQLSTIPEPTAAAMMTCALLLIARRPRRRKEVRWKRSTLAFVAGLVVLTFSMPAAASPGSWDDFIESSGGGIVWDQQPLPTGGPGADTDFYTDSGLQFWQLNADDIILAESATIRRIIWWGFYGGNFSGSTLPPTGAETMRVRFYAARPVDGLPGEILFEESVLNPPRTETGIINSSNGGLEYLFQADLTTPHQLNAGVPYWLEIVQIGDVDSHYRWEYSLPTGTPYAHKNVWLPDWVLTPLGANVAFQLSTIPEPTTILPIACGFMLMARRRERKEVSRKQAN